MYSDWSYTAWDGCRCDAYETPIPTASYRHNIKAMHCTSCGAQIGEGAAYCAGCGAKIGNLTEAEKDRTPEDPAQTDSARHRDYLQGFSWGFFGNPLLYSVSMRFSAGPVALAILANFALYSASKSVEASPTSSGAVGALVVELAAYATIAYVALGMRRTAHERRKWKGWDDFVSCQRTWDVWGMVLGGIGLAILAYQCLQVISLLSSGS